jgi:hypothetical protein
VVLHPSTVIALREYVDLRDRTPGTANTAAFFVSTRGRLMVNTIDYTFADLREAAGIRVSPGVRPPRVYDFRHSFAVATLLDWYRAGVDVQTRLPVLSTWLDHINPASTYWYLQAAPELLALAAARLEHTARDLESNVIQLPDMPRTDRDHTEFVGRPPAAGGLPLRRVGRAVLTVALETDLVTTLGCGIGSAGWEWAEDGCGSLVGRSSRSRWPALAW